ncbi:hypothetical protein PPERSA_05558 [Pseudocohnilembus persalinus]|uniref:Uncharacterized protein n=1 Tax=Pseudocohnilembus persalinus TaxID=266149 RepID=A0A0V0QU49_PSEPJ|nr:hypothetical protein PPERSA_05558 [Pseudocohnilembus persalinus]|eukprot:KRX05448.1 hypothetical protein PPERSA_05558 [Pseudocohnilembus persalinus]
MQQHQNSNIRTQIYNTNGKQNQGENLDKEQLAPLQYKIPEYYNQISQNCQSQTNKNSREQQSDFNNQESSLSIQNQTANSINQIQTNMNSVLSPLQKQNITEDLGEQPSKKIKINQQKQIPKQNTIKNEGFQKCRKQIIKNVRKQYYKLFKEYDISPSEIFQKYSGSQDDESYEQSQNKSKNNNNDNDNFTQEINCQPNLNQNQNQNIIINKNDDNGDIKQQIKNQKEDNTDQQESKQLQVTQLQKLQKPIQNQDNSVQQENQNQIFTNTGSQQNQNLGFMNNQYQNNFNFPINFGQMNFEIFKQQQSQLQQQQNNLFIDSPSCINNNINKNFYMQNMVQMDIQNQNNPNNNYNFAQFHTMNNYFNVETDIQKKKQFGVKEEQADLEKNILNHNNSNNLNINNNINYNRSDKNQNENLNSDKSKNNLQRKISQQESEQDIKKKKQRGVDVQVDQGGNITSKLYSFNQNDILTGHVPTNFMNILLPYLINFYAKYLCCKINKNVRYDGLYDSRIYKGIEEEQQSEKFEIQNPEKMESLLNQLNKYKNQDEISQKEQLLKLKQTQEIKLISNEQKLQRIKEEDNSDNKDKYKENNENNLGNDNNELNYYEVKKFKNDSNKGQIKDQKISKILQDFNNCDCQVCKEYNFIRKLHGVKRNKSIKSFVDLWKSTRIRIISEDFILWHCQQCILQKNSYRNLKNKLSLLYCLKNILSGVKQPNIFHKLL